MTWQAGHPLVEIDVASVTDAYHRRGLADLDDDRLIRSAAEVVGVPMGAVLPDQRSFVLHAPLELLARAALLPSVTPSAREGARLRIVALAAAYQASGSPLAWTLGGPTAGADDPAPPAAIARQLAESIRDGDLDAVDRSAARLGRSATADEVSDALADVAVDQLAAAGHANIFLALLPRTQPRGLPAQMVRQPAHELAVDGDHPMRLPPVRSAPPGGDPGAAVATLLARLAAIPLVGPPPEPRIASLVEHADTRGAIDAILDDDGTFAAPVDGSHALLRFAAQAMLQGTPDAAPYGWTHCLTLAQAPLLIAQRLSEPARARFVAAAYLAAHWAAYGTSRLDLSRVPDGAPASLAEGIAGAAGLAASVAWHEPDRRATTAALATAASLAHDAHLVKYTLACLDAASADPAGEPIYLAAAAHLHSWWHHHPDADDPVREQVQASVTGR